RPGAGGNRGGGVRGAAMTPQKNSRGGRTMRQHLNGIHDRRRDDVSGLARRLATLALPALAVLPAVARGQDSVVAGVVVAEVSQRPLPGAQIVVEGAPARGAVADASGHFRITGLSGTAVTLSARLI